jgi:hypothetical protein
MPDAPPDLPLQECEESRSFLVQISRRCVDKSMASGMHTGLSCGYCPTSTTGKHSNLDEVAADLRRMEYMLRAEQATEQQLRNARSEFVC